MNKKLPQNELERYKVIFENVTDIVTFVDTKGKIIDINSRITDILGYEKDEVIGKYFFKLPFVDLSLIGDLLTLFRDTILSGKAKNNIEVVLKSKTEKEYTFEVNTSFIKEDGKVVGVINIFRDITFSKRSFELLKESSYNLKERVKELNALYSVNRIIANFDMSRDEIFQEIADVIPQGFQYPDLAHTKIKFNGNEYTSRGFTESDSKITKDIILDGEKMGEIIIEYEKRKDIEADKSYGYFLEEEISLIEAVVDDIVQFLRRLKAEEDLRGSERWRKSILENVTDAVIILDKELKVSLWNRGSVKLFGFSKKEAMGLHINQLFTDDFSDEINNDENSGIFIKNFETNSKAKDGQEIPSEISLDKWTIDNKDFITIIVRDIRDRLKAQERLVFKDKVLQILNDAAKQLLLGQNWEENIINLLTQLLELMDVGRVYLFKNYKEDQKILGEQIYEVVTEGVEALIDNEDLKKLDYEAFGLKYVYNKLSGGDPLVGQIDHLPEPEKDFFSQQDIVSIAAVPIFIKDDWWGFIGFDEVTKTRDWTDNDIRILRSIANMIGAAVQYSESRNKIEEINKQLEDKNYELEKTNKLMVGREVKMIELKNRIKELEELVDLRSGDEN